MTDLNLTDVRDLRWFHAEEIRHAMKMPDSAITDRPWKGVCATTRITMDDYRLRLANVNREGVPEWITRAAVAICRSHSIGGLSGPAYIANVINDQYKAALTT